jgi:DNA-binding NarL/FixJ family response regulator
MRSAWLTVGDGAHCKTTGDLAYPDLAFLARAGFSQMDIAILDGIQRDGLDKEVAAEIGLSVSAIRKHLKKIGRRLNARGRAQMIARACAESRTLEEAGK